MNKAYDTTGARKLLPLLEVISREIGERWQSVRAIHARIQRHSGKEPKEFQDLKAELANHRREIRLAIKELERLGCSIDEDNPTRIIIPGSDGFDDGFEWDSMDPTLRRVSNDTSVG